jgi:hypothetical protein
MKKLLSIFLILFWAGTVNAAIIFQDGFEHAGASQQDFLNAGWGNFKEWAGHITTVTQSAFQTSTGNSLALPGTIGGNNRVCKFSLHAGQDQTQTDTYLSVQDGTANYIPKNIWIQFWVYFNRYGSEMSKWMNHHKMLYPGHSDNYTSSSHPWLITYGTMAGLDGDLNGYEPFGDPVQSQYYGYANVYDWSETGGTQNADLITVYSTYGNWNKVSPSGLFRNIRPNCWTLIKLHIDYTTANQGIFGLWLKEYHTSPRWNGFYELILNNAVRYDLVDGVDTTAMHHILLYFQTPGTADPIYNDAYVYVDDFILATTEADLPTYDGISPSPPVLQGVKISGGKVQ